MKGFIPNEEMLNAHPREQIIVTTIVDKTTLRVENFVELNKRYYDETCEDPTEEEIIENGVVVSGPANNVELLRWLTDDGECNANDTEVLLIIGGIPYKMIGLVPES